MRARPTSSALAAIIVLASVVTAVGQPQGSEVLPRFPSIVTTIDGAQLDLEELARRTTLVVVTLKATWCPVCRRQLERIHDRRDYLADCGVSFLVLAPGPAEELAAIREQTGFEHPFVVDEGLEIARSLGLQLADGEIVPAILMLDSDLSVGWMQRGRSGRFYGDGALVEKVECWERIPI